MGDVAATLKVMPADADIDLDALEDRLAEALPDGARIRATERSEVAFGLVAILASVVVPDDTGGTEAVEKAFGDLEDVQSVTVENVGRL